ncbi:MAG: redox-regulated ATPase YchF [Deltaproteobacteria bacterium]|nr:redox-regulated ATPase YchF [Deltaproteobacteria bacterium]
MKVGLIGRRGSGKTTIFNMLTGLEAQVGGYPGGDKAEIHLGVIKVPDQRIDRLAEIFQPKKTTYARDFDAQADPLKELNDLLAEMTFADLVVVENRLGRLKKEKGKEQELPLLERCRKALENEEGLRNLSLNPDEESLLAGFGFLSRKPLLALFNTSDERAGQPLLPAYEEELRRRGIQSLALAGKVEMEIAQLNEADRAAFLKEIGIEEPARARFIRASYQLLDLISFLTTGKDEVRAWTIKRGTTARKAAGKIHSDIERGFIRAEVVPYEEFIALGSEAKCREAGKLRLEGKDYVVQDGDIIHFRFNV